MCRDINLLPYVSFLFYWCSTLFMCMGVFVSLSPSYGFISGCHPLYEITISIDVFGKLQTPNFTDFFFVVRVNVNLWYYFKGKKKQQKFNPFQFFFRLFNHFYLHSEWAHERTMEFNSISWITRQIFVYLVFVFVLVLHFTNRFYSLCKFEYVTVSLLLLFLSKCSMTLTKHEDHHTSGQYTIVGK